MASTCIHGFAPGTCLICQTLGTSDSSSPSGTAGAAGTAKPVATEAAPRSRRVARSALARRDPGRAAVEPTSPRVLPAEGRGPRSGLGLRLAVLVIGAFIVVALAWSVFHLVFAILRILELIAVALVAGWLGWKAGVHHGRRTAPPPKGR